MSVVSSPRLKSPAIHIITIIPVPQSCIIMARLHSSGVVLAHAHTPGVTAGTERQADATIELGRDA
jgi:hypothetical protein